MKNNNETTLGNFNIFPYEVLFHIIDYFYANESLKDTLQLAQVNKPFKRLIGNFIKVILAEEKKPNLEKQGPLSSRMSFFTDPSDESLDLLCDYKKRLKDVLKTYNSKRSDRKARRSKIPFKPGTNFDGLIYLLYGIIVLAPVIYSLISYGISNDVNFYMNFLNYLIDWLTKDITNPAANQIANVITLIDILYVQMFLLLVITRGINETIMYLKDNINYYLEKSRCNARFSAAADKDDMKNASKAIRIYEWLGAMELKEEQQEFGKAIDIENLRFVLALAQKNVSRIEEIVEVKVDESSSLLSMQRH